MSSLRFRREIAMPRAITIVGEDGITVERENGIITIGLDDAIFPSFAPAMPLVIGDMLYATSSTTLDNVPPNTSAVMKVLTQTGDGTTAGAPEWGAVSLVEDPSKVSYTTPQSLTNAEQTQARTNIYAAPFDAQAHNGIQINGSMEVDQPNAGNAYTIAAGSVIATVMDGWKADKTGTNAFAIQQATSVFPGYSKELKLTITTAQASISTNAIDLRQYIEGYRTSRLAWGTASAIPLTVGFWVKSSVAGIVGMSISNSAFTSTSNASVTITSPAVAQFVTATFAAVTTGTWLTDSSTGMVLTIRVAGASQINIAATNGNTFEITGLILVPGSQAPVGSQASLIMRPFAEELRLCQRYYWKSFPYVTSVGFGKGRNDTIEYIVKRAGVGVYDQVYIPLPAEMRAFPSFTGYSPVSSSSNWYNYNASIDSGASFSVYPGGKRLMIGIGTQLAGDALNHSLALHATADARL